MRQTRRGADRQARAAMSGLEAAALAEQMQLQRIEFALEKAARDARYAEADRVARGAQGSDGARGATRPVGRPTGITKVYYPPARHLHRRLLSHVRTHAGCLVLAPRCPAPSRRRRRVRRDLRPHPAARSSVPSRVGGPPRVRPPPPPRPSPGVGIPRGNPRARPATASSVPRRPRGPCRRTLRTRLRTRLGPLRTRLLRRSRETRACHPRDRNPPPPTPPGRIVLAPVIPGVYPGTPPNIPPGNLTSLGADECLFQDPNNAVSGLSKTPRLPDPPRGVDATPPRTRVKGDVPRADYVRIRRPQTSGTPNIDDVQRGP